MEDHWKLSYKPGNSEEEEIEEGKFGLYSSLPLSVFLAIPYKGSFCDSVCICNPCTSEYTILPRTSTIKYWVGNIVSGFGYLPSTDEYKVVRILYPYKGYKRPASEDDKILVQVYTLGKNSSSGWRNITAVPPGLLHREGIFPNGSLYWKYLNEDNNNTNGLVAFDLVDESFQVLPTPPCIQFPSEKDSVYFVKMLGGHLCLIDHANGSSCGDVIEQEYYRDWIWSKDFSVELEQNGRFYEPFALTKNNQVLIWSQSSIKCYDPITKSLSVVVERERDSSFETFKGVLHMNTLVSLKWKLQGNPFYRFSIP
ncbi:F-box/kelch-repeat protein At3g06240-like [Papaver somniferum]|uniref:F-box/kelch-repeat protein At3g06240-like n=1 Tax=Papaver somniferum TaxID=3469 RepID=UPI000E7052B5|nr:F-box/kelch-repeat protein At3g06240-like [Papaver somniferum]